MTWIFKFKLDTHRVTKSHKVEQVMSSLNEACGDGQFISQPSESLIESLGEEDLIHLNPQQWSELEEKKHGKGARFCATEVAKRYTGTRCMGTTVHAHAPEPDDLTQNFFFDEKYLLPHCIQSQETNPSWE